MLAQTDTSANYTRAVWPGSGSGTAQLQLSLLGGRRRPKRQNDGGKHKCISANGHWCFADHCALHHLALRTAQREYHVLMQTRCGSATEQYVRYTDVGPFHAVASVALVLVDHA